MEQSDKVYNGGGATRAQGQRRNNNKKQTNEQRKPDQFKVNFKNVFSDAIESES